MLMNHTLPRSTLTAAAALLLAGCAVGPDYTRPDAPVPAQYKQAPVDAYGARWQSAQPADEAPTGAWWQIFQAPELDALMAQLHAGTPTIARAEAQYRAAQALLQQAQAKLFPTLDARLAAQRTDSAGQRTEQTSAALAASWTPDLWGGVRRSIEANDADAQARYARLAGVRLSAEAQLSESATFWMHKGSSTTPAYFRKLWTFTGLVCSFNPCLRPEDMNFSNMASRYVEGWFWEHAGENTVALTIETTYNCYSFDRDGLWADNDNIRAFGKRTLQAIAEYLELSLPGRYLVETPARMKAGWEPYRGDARSFLGTEAGRPPATAPGLPIS